MRIIQYKIIYQSGRIAQRKTAAADVVHRVLRAMSLWRFLLSLSLEKRGEFGWYNYSHRYAHIHTHARANKMKFYLCRLQQQVNGVWSSALGREFRSSVPGVMTIITVSFSGFNNDVVTTTIRWHGPAKTASDGTPPNYP